MAPSCWNHTCSVSTSSSLGRRKVSNISTYRSAGTVTVAPPSSQNKKVRADPTKVGSCTPNSYSRRVKQSFLEFTWVTFSPVAKILLVYGSTEVEVSLIATLEEQLQQRPVQEFPHLWLCGWHDLSLSLSLEVSLIATLEEQLQQRPV